MKPQQIIYFQVSPSSFHIIWKDIKDVNNLSWWRCSCGNANSNTWQGGGKNGEDVTHCFNCGKDKPIQPIT